MFLSAEDAEVTELAATPQKWSTRIERGNHYKSVGELASADKADKHPIHVNFAVASENLRLSAQSQCGDYFLAPSVEYELPATAFCASAQAGLPGDIF